MKEIFWIAYIQTIETSAVDIFTNVQMGQICMLQYNNNNIAFFPKQVGVG